MTNLVDQDLADVGEQENAQQEHDPKGCYEKALADHAAHEVWHCEEEEVEDEDEEGADVEEQLR